MFHCPYLLHKFVINYLFDYYYLCLVYLSYRLLYYSISIFYGVVAVPLPSRLLHLYDCDYEIYNIVAQPYYCWWTLYWNNRNAPPTYVFIVWKEDASLPAMFNPLYNSTNQQLFKRNFCNQSSYYENYEWFNGSHHMPTTKSTLFKVNKDGWYTKEGHAKSMKNALYVQWYGKRHLSGWSDVEQRKNQTCSLSHYWDTRVWRHRQVGG